MKGKIIDVNISGRKCFLYLPPEYEKSKKRYPVIYVNGADDLEGIIDLIEPNFNISCMEFLLLNIESENWGAEYTPWPAKQIFSQGEPFLGNADEYLKVIEDIIKPYIDENYRTLREPSYTSLVGYSLGGLMALYSLYKSMIFKNVASMSGSLWYDGLIKFMNKNKPMNLDSRVYISLGKKEMNSRNKRMASVDICTRKVFDMLKKDIQNIENLKLEWNEGGHFTKISERFAKAIMWIAKK